MNMSPDYLLSVTREALFLVLLVSAPPVLAVLVAGSISGFLQSAFRMRDEALSFVPKLVAAIGALLIAAPWIAAQVTEFTDVLFHGISSVGQ